MAESQVVLLPCPRRIRSGRRVVRPFPGAWVLVDPAASDALCARVSDFADATVRPLGGRLRVGKAAQVTGDVFLRITLGDRDLPAQGYRIAPKRGGVELTAADEAGAFYGLQTLRQLIDPCGPNLPQLTIADWPDLPNRGVHMDVSRNKVMTLETLFAYVDRLASWKVNQLTLYTEHAFAYSKHEKIWAGASPYTPEDMLKLDAYCRERFIELVPNQNSFGHARPWLRHPEYKHLAECPEGSGGSDHGFQFKADGETLAFLDDLYRELFPHFSSRLFHAGCDETKETGLGASKVPAARIGAHKVYLDFLKRIHKLVKRHKHRMMFWADIILESPELVAALPKDIVALVWGYEPDYPFARHCRICADAGIAHYVCPSTATHRNIAGDTDMCLGNIRNAARNGVRFGADGLMNTDWGDFGHAQHQPVSYLGFAAGAAMGWCYAKNRDLDMAEALTRHVYRDRAGVMGRLAVDAGRVQNGINVVPKRGVLFHCLAADDPKDALRGKLTRRQVTRCIERIDALRETLRRADCRLPDADLVAREWANTLGFCRHAARRALRAVGGRVSPHDLRRERLALIEEFESIWTARNRIGGLYHTSGALRRAL